MKTVVLLFLSTMLALAGCKKTTTDPPAPGPPAPTPAADRDRVEVLARHRATAGPEDLAADPVVVHIHKFAVTKASFDPKNLEGGTATLELDMASIASGSVERDEDLKSPAFIDVGKFATATVTVTNVKKQTDTRYTADATVALRGTTKTYPVTFDVLATTADTVRIKGEHAFSRLDFSIGVDPAIDPSDRIDTGLTIQWVLTLKNS